MPLLLANTTAANSLALESKQSMNITGSNGYPVSWISLNGHKYYISNFSCDGAPQACDAGDNTLTTIAFSDQ
jgi:hypothetical protein